MHPLEVFTHFVSQFTQIREMRRKEMGGNIFENQNYERLNRKRATMRRRAETLEAYLRIEADAFVKRHT